MRAFFHLARLSRLSVCLRHLVFIEGESPLKLPLSAYGLHRDEKYRFPGWSRAQGRLFSLPSP